MNETCKFNLHQHDIVAKTSQQVAKMLQQQSLLWRLLLFFLIAGPVTSAYTIAPLHATEAGRNSHSAVTPSTQQTTTAETSQRPQQSQTANSVAARLRGKSCQDMRLLRNKLVNRGIKKNMAKGPQWAVANLSPDQLLDVKIYITVVERLKFRCGGSKNFAPSKQTQKRSQPQRKAKAALKSKKKPSASSKTKKRVYKNQKKRVYKKKKYRKVAKKKTKKVDDIYTTTDAFR